MTIATSLATFGLTMTLTRTRTPTEGVVPTTGDTIGHVAPWRKVDGRLLEAAARTAHVEKMPAPFVLQASLDDVYGELRANIQDAFNAGAVEIMSPHYAALRVERAEGDS